MSEADDGGLAIVRVKPMGAGGGGVEASGAGLADGEGALRFANAADAGSAGGGGQIRIVGGVGTPSGEGEGPLSLVCQILFLCCSSWFVADVLEHQRS